MLTELLGAVLHALPLARSVVRGGALGTGTDTDTISSPAPMNEESFLTPNSNTQPHSIYIT
jgi:hypothetical protein